MDISDEHTARLPHEPTTAAGHSRPAWFRFTVREILLAVVAIAALLGWLVNSPLVSLSQSDFFTNFDPIAELRAAGQKLPSAIQSRSRHLSERVITVEHSDMEARDVMLLLRKRMRGYMDDSQITLRSERATKTGRYPDFVLHYRQGRIDGVVICRAFPAEDAGHWQLYVVMHELVRGW